VKVLNCYFDSLNVMIAILFQTTSMDSVTVQAICDSRRSISWFEVIEYYENLTTILPLKVTN